MRSGADGRTRIASSPAMRINCLRRRAKVDGGNTIGFVIVPGSSWSGIPMHARTRPAGARLSSIELLAMARGQHAVAVQQQRGDADEFLDFRQCFLVFFVAVVLRRGSGQACEVGERLRGLLRQWRRLS